MQYGTENDWMVSNYIVCDDLGGEGGRPSCRKSVNVIFMYQRTRNMASPAGRASENLLEFGNKRWYHFLLTCFLHVCLVVYQDWLKKTVTLLQSFHMRWDAYTSVRMLTDVAPNVYTWWIPAPMNHIIDWTNIHFHCHLHKVIHLTSNGHSASAVQSLMMVRCILPDCRASFNLCTMHPLHFR